MILEELSKPYTLNLIPFDHLVSKEFRSLTPIGKVPVMHDPNTNLMLFESGAIIQYLIEMYDGECRISYEELRERHLCNQWLMVQMSQQGPFFGQLSWFQYFHPEDVPSAKERYFKQVERVLGVLEVALEGKEWLVGDRCTFADISFFMWNELLPSVTRTKEEDTILNKFPRVLNWHERMRERRAVGKVVEMRNKAIAEDGMKEAIEANDPEHWRELGNRTNAGGE